MKTNLIYDYQIFLKQKFGGPSRYFVELNKNINQKKFNNSIVAPFHINRHLLNTNFNKGNFFFYKKFIFNRTLKKLNEFIFLKKIKNLLNPIIHSTYYDLRYLRQVKCAKIVTIHDLIHEKFYKDKKIDYEDNKINCINDADFFICVSKSTQNDLIEHYNIDKKKTKVIYHSCTLPDVDYGFIKKKDFILFVGNRSGYKNSYFALKAFSKYKRIRDKIDFYFFGGLKFSKNEITNFRDLGIINNVKYLGNDERKLKSLYKKATCLIYPSNYEGFGIPLLEAMENNCPIICTDTPALKEIGADAVQYFEKNNEESFIDSLDKVLYSDELSNKLKILGKKRRNFFSWEKCARETEEVYSYFY